jgi:hypothetical protein
MTPTITASFSPDLKLCTVTVRDGRGGCTYENLPVTARVIAERKEDRRVIEREWLFSVVIPCEREFDEKLMLVIDGDAANECRRWNW